MWDFNLDLKVSRLTDVQRSSVGNELHTVGAEDICLMIHGYIDLLSCCTLVSVVDDVQAILIYCHVVH